MKLKSAALALATAAAVVAPARAPAMASPVVVATYFQYVPRQVGDAVEIVEGTSLLLSHLDALAANFYVPWHDLRSVAEDEWGEPLFASPLLGFGETDYVYGVEDLAPATYEFYCQNHTDLEMRGELIVRAEIG